MKTFALIMIAVALSSSARAQQSPPQATPADRAAPAPLGPTLAYAFERAAKAALENGLTLSLVSSHRLPLVAVTLVVPRASAALDPIGREGLADFVAAMSQEGVPGLPTAAALSDAVDDLGATISVQAKDEGLTVSVLVLKENLARAMRLVGLFIREPSHLSAAPEYAQALERERQRALSALDMEKSDPEALAGDRLSSALFGDGPHGRRPTEASLRAITPADVAARQRAAVVPDGAVLAVAGDVTLEELKTLAAENFGSWRPANRTMVAVPHGVPVAGPAGRAAPRADGLVIEIIDIPGEQAEMALGAKTLPRLHQDHDALSLAVGVLGGPMIGRLDQNIRETHHWAYGARASMIAWKDAGIVKMETKVQVDRTGDALREILAEVERLAESSVPDAELLAAKTYLKGAYLRNTRTVQNLSARLASAETIGLPPSVLTDYAARMDALTAAQVRAAAKVWLAPSSLRIVIAGPAGLILPQLKGMGTVQVFDPAGRPKTGSNS